MTIYDCIIVGGGINGCGIAADAAGRGLSVALVEKTDLGAATSSASSKLIHGGLRYLEHYEFRLVREALRERDVLMSIAPHLIQPLKFILPHDKSMRPTWLIRLGLFLYDHLGGRISLPKSRLLRLAKHSAGKVLKSTFSKAFSYYDCQTNDSRLVISNALSARQNGAAIFPHTEFMHAREQKGLWHVDIQPHDGSPQTLVGKTIINATGPWCDRLLQRIDNVNSRHRLRLIKGSHIVVPKLYDDDYAFILQHTDKRIVFVTPYFGEFNMVGTTDVEYEGDPRHVNASEEEITYLCDIVNHYFQRQVSTDDVVTTWAGVRPLVSEAEDNPSAVTRDYQLELLTTPAPIVNVYGGKITTYRKLAEAVLEKLTPYFPHAGKPWTANHPLPGGDLSQSLEDFIVSCQAHYAFLPADCIRRYVHAYGTRLHDLLRDCESLADMGEYFGQDLYEREVRFLIEQEWASNCDDILWRRSRIGMHFTSAQTERLATWLSQHSKP